MLVRIHICIVSIIFAIALVGCSGGVTQISGATNFKNGSYAVASDGWIYYSNFDDENKLYKIKTNGLGRNNSIEWLGLFP